MFSLAAGARRFTNHQLRSTSIKGMQDNNVEASEVVKVSGHKDLKSIKTYNPGLDRRREREISRIISNLGAQNHIGMFTISLQRSKLRYDIDKFFFINIAF